MNTSTVKNASAAGLGILRHPLKDQRVGIFSRRYELFCLGIPIAFMFVLVLDVFFLRAMSGGSTQRRLNRFVTSLFFFNSIHVYFTFASLVTVPELRRWVVDTTGGKPWRFWLEIAGVSLITCVLTGIAFFGIPITDKTLPIIGVVMTGIIPFHHTIMQVFGLSMLYNARLAKTKSFTEIEKQAARACSTRERWGFRLFMFFFFSYLSAILASNILDSTSLRTLRHTLFWLSNASVLFIIFNSLTFPHAIGSNKTVFLARLIYYPLLPFSVFADSAMRACHGTEYFCVTESIAKNSSMSATVRRHFYTVLLLFVALGIVFLICREVDGLVGFWYGSYDKVPWPLKVLAFVSIVVTYTHYYLDRRLFRFRNASNREHVLPLLSGD